MRVDSPENRARISMQMRRIWRERGAERRAQIRRALGSAPEAEEDDEDPEGPPETPEDPHEIARFVNVFSAAYRGGASLHEALEVARADEDADGPGEEDAPL